MTNLPKAIKRICAVMLILMMTSTTAFASNPFTSRSTIVDQASGGYTKLTIYRNHPEDSAPFQVKNMLPGDAITHTYYLAVSYKGTITVHFHADIKSGYEKLAEVLKCSVVLSDTGECLYDGLMRDMPASLDRTLISRGVTTEELAYEITTYLDTSVGNDYMAKELFADFRWWAVAQEIPEDEEYYTPDDNRGDKNPNDTESAKSGEMPGDQMDLEVKGEYEEFLPGQLAVLPMTGDASLIPYIAGAVGCVLLLIILLLRRKRKEDDGNEE